MNSQVWLDYYHDRIEEDITQTVRVRIIHHHDLTAYHTMAPLHLRVDATHATHPQSTSKTIYSTGPSTEIGFWMCTPGSFSVSHKTHTEWFHVLEGVFFLTNHVDGTSQKCVAGDTILLPQGWRGDFDIIETVKKLWVEV
jgi:uncharacterized protein